MQASGQLHLLAPASEFLWLHQPQTVTIDSEKILCQDLKHEYEAKVCNVLLCKFLSAIYAKCVW